MVGTSSARPARRSSTRLPMPSRMASHRAKGTSFAAQRRSRSRSGPSAHWSPLRAEGWRRPGPVAPTSFGTTNWWTSRFRRPICGRTTPRWRRGLACRQPPMTCRPSPPSRRRISPRCLPMPTPPTSCAGMPAGVPGCRPRGLRWGVPGSPCSRRHWGIASRVGNSGAASGGVRGRHSMRRATPCGSSWRCRDSPTGPDCWCVACCGVGMATPSESRRFRCPGGRRPSCGATGWSWRPGR